MMTNLKLYLINYLNKQSSPAPRVVWKAQTIKFCGYHNENSVFLSSLQTQRETEEMTENL